MIIYGINNVRGECYKNNKISVIDKDFLEKEIKVITNSNINILNNLSENSNFKCYTCDKIFNDKDTMSRHRCIKILHEEKIILTYRNNESMSNRLLVHNEIIIFIKEGIDHGYRGENYKNL